MVAQRAALAAAEVADEAVFGRPVTVGRPTVEIPRRAGHSAASRRLPEVAPEATAASAQGLYANRDFLWPNAGTGRTDIAVLGQPQPRAGHDEQRACGVARRSAARRRGSVGTQRAHQLLEDMFLRGFGGRCLDLQGGNTADGTPIQMWTCGALGGANQKWAFSGRLRYANVGTLCLARSSDASGEGLSLAGCGGTDETQAWDFYF
jgi:hypothetical protein